MTMRRLTPYLIATYLMIAFSFLATNAAFSQTDQGDKTATEKTESQSAPTTYVKGITPSRAKTLVGGVIGLVSIVIGWRVKRRSAVSAGGGRTWTVTGLILGIGVIVFSVFHLANTKGDFGSGGGKAGAIVAMVLGFVGVVLNGLLLRSKRKG
jgi:hypothetical protein